MGEVIAHFHQGPLDQPGMTRVLASGQMEYRFIDDVSGRSGDYWLSVCDEPGACFEWMGWRE